MAMDQPRRVPGTPSRGRDAIFNRMISLLNDEWDLRLKVRQDWSSSPAKGKRTPKDECLSNLRFCFHKELLDAGLRAFRLEANRLYSTWVEKPRAERGDIPSASRDRPRPVSDKERSELVECLNNILRAKKNSWLASDASPLSRKQVVSSFADQAVPFALSPQRGTAKRFREESFPDLTSNTKKAKKTEGHASRSFEDMLPPDRVEMGRSFREEASLSRSASTSFAASEASSIFSRPFFGGSTMTSTQETIPDDELPKARHDRPALTTIQHDRKQSSDYGSSSFEGIIGDASEGDLVQHPAILDDEQEGMPQDVNDIGIQEGMILNPMEAVLWNRLQGIFPELPTCLQALPLCVVYEITRVFLHAEIPIKEFDAQALFLEPGPFTDYEKLWRALKSLPSLRGIDMPERCGKEVWAAAIDVTRRSVYSIVFAGTLRFNTDPEGPFFRLKLESMKLDKSHRLGRRFGHDRFLEICIPPLTGKQLPEPLLKLGDRGRDIIIDWLIDSKHSLLDRKWMPFFVKPKERRSSKKADPEKGLDMAEPTFRVYFFAIDGGGFARDRKLIANPENGKHPVMTISDLLNRIRPTKLNMSGSYLKLFSRTSLALSRNSETILLEPSQIKFQERDLTCEYEFKNDDTGLMETKSEVMNDGAGLMSRNLAARIAQARGLDYVPSAFQGRLGEAKGLWIVDDRDKSGDDWIKVYPSQQKWNRSTTLNGESNDPSHRTFEFLKCSGPLRSADLNTQFLPLLMNRAVDKGRMQNALAELLRQGLLTEVDSIQKAVENPMSFRQWVRGSNPNINDRLKNGAVPFRAGLPIIKEERLNAMLDVGFQPKSLEFMAGLTRDIFKNHADELITRLNIKVGRSAYVYMIPDFWDALDPGEVYLDLPEFVDGVSGLSGAMLNGVDLLVARAPAHFISDIQKVKSVAKVQLIGLKNVIVFPTKGSTRDSPSLAAKLSGGDYDGDIAWVCWEESIVDNFVTADVPEMPDLVKEGLLRKDSTTYMELVRGHPNPDSQFLKKSFAFNMQQSLLGICTNWKDKICETQGGVDSKEALYLSKLLSDLVDAFKQGFIFGEEDWKEFKNQRVKVKVKESWTFGKDPNFKSKFINHYLICVADETIKAALEEIHKKFGTPPYFDDDLVKEYREKREFAKNEPQWKELLDYLDEDLNPITEKWKNYFDRPDETVPEFSGHVVARFEEFRDIRPHVTSALTQSLTSGGCPELCNWELLKASALYAKYSKSYVSKVVWWVAGRQLLRLKADYGNNGIPHSVIPSMYASFRPDSNFIRRFISEGSRGGEEDIGSVGNVEELEALQDDE